MKISLPQLAAQLEKSLAGIYLVSGDEVLLVEEAIQLICQAAQKQGFSERQHITADAEWTKSLYTSTHSLSLFSTKQLLLLDLSNTKFTAASSKLLQDFASNLPADTLLIIRMQKLDGRTAQSAWHQAIEKKGVVVTIWPINPQQLPAWIIQRAKKIGLQITQRGAELLAYCCEGNLLAAAQEIEKLQLLNLSSTIDEKIILELIHDNAHFDIFTLVESALSGNSSRSLRILKHLQAESIEPTLVLWAFTNELRLLNNLTRQTQQGTPLSSLFTKYRVWEKRQGAIQQFLRRSKQQDCWDLLITAAEIDRIIKGAESGNTWDSLQKLALAMSANSYKNAIM